MNTVTQQVITVDYQITRQVKTVSFLQFDTNEIKFIVEDGGSVADLSNITQIVVNFKRPDKKIITQFLTKTGNEIVYRLTNSEMAKVGTSEMVLQLYDGDNDRVSIAKFNVNIQDNIEIGQEPTVEDVSLVTKLIQSVNERIAELNDYDVLLSNKANQTDVETKFANRDSLYKTTLPFTPKTTGYIHIMGGIDSQTAGSAGFAYSKQFGQRMRGEFGSGGNGYAGFEVLTGVDAFGGITSNGFNTIPLENNGTGYGIYSFDNKGVYVDNPKGTETYKHNLSISVYDKVTLFYLKQPNGGNFDVYYTGDKTNSLQTVNTNNTTNDIGAIDLGYKRGTTGITIDNCNGGKICIFAMFLKRDNGYIFSTIGGGGQKLQWHNNTNATIREKWLTLLKPDTFIFIAGGNDASDLSASQYDGVLRSYLQPYINTNTPIILGRSGARNGGEGTMIEYEKVLYDYAKEKKLEFLNIRELFGGTYQSSVEGGYVQSDGIHNSERGCLKVANALLDIFNVPKVGVTFDDRTDPTPQTFITDLGTKHKAIANGVTDNLYRLGFQSPTKYGFVEIEVTAFRASALSYARKKLRVNFNVGSVTNQCTGMSNLVIEDVFNYKAGGNDINFTLTAIIENGLLCIKATSNNYDLEYNSTCKVNYLYTQAGRNVWDN